MRVIIAGSRTITDYDKVVEAIIDSGFHITEVICGKARGVDTLGKRWAKKHNIPVQEFPAEWARYGRRAGPERNRDMAEYASDFENPNRPDNGGLILVWDGKSRGSANMLYNAKRYGLEIYTLEV